MEPSTIWIRPAMAWAGHTEAHHSETLIERWKLGWKFRIYNIDGKTVGGSYVTIHDVRGKKLKVMGHLSHKNFEYPS